MRTATISIPTALKYRIKVLEEENAQLKKALQSRSTHFIVTRTSHNDDYEDRATKFMRTREY